MLHQQTQIAGVPQPPTARRGRSPLQTSLIAVAVFGAYWCLLLWHLGVRWGASAEYSYGWLAPCVSAYLLFLRWMARPPADRGNVRAASWIFAGSAATFSVVWLFDQPNSDWRLISWLLTLQVLGLSFCGFYFAGGARWLRHFSGCFWPILASVPWPREIEHAITSALMQAVTSATVFLLHCFLISATQHGNVIELSSGLLGIDEACSGVRSLQATIMVALFLGELYRTSWLRRLLLLVAGGCIAFGCNVLRAFLLAAVAARSGTDAVATWHDATGICLLGLCFLAIWLAARFVAHPESNVWAGPAHSPRKLPVGLFALAGVWVCSTVVGTEIWFRTHERRAPEQWTVDLPSNQTFSPVEIPKAVSDTLAFSDGQAGSWDQGDGNRWTAYHFRWSAGSVRSRILARLHRPENCFPGAGYVLEADRGLFPVQDGKLILPFHSLTYRYNGEHVYVFFCLWEDQLLAAEQGRSRVDWDWRARVEAVWRGERNLSQQVLELIVQGPESAAAAEAALRQEIPRLVRD